MQQLSGLDTTFLNIETSTTYGHIGGLALFDPSTAPHTSSIDELKELLRERLHLVPHYRRRLVEVPFGIDQPYWIEDPEFDLDFHVRHVGLPPPGNRHQLVELVERIVSRPLDRSRPLWELYFIEGLEDGLVAQLTKTHHAAIDGVGGADMLGSLLDLTPEPRRVEPPDEPWVPDAIPTELEMWNRGIASLQTKPSLAFKMWTEWLGSLTKLASTPSLRMPPVGSASGDPGPTADVLMSRATTTPPHTSFNALIGPHRRFAFTSIPLDDVKAVKDHHNVTFNDVVLTVCAGALRTYLDRRDELPDKPLIAMVPVSVRSEDRPGEPGNHVASITTSLHTDLGDPAARLARIHEEMVVAKDAHNAVSPELAQDLAQYTPPSIAGLTARASAKAAAQRWADLPYNVVISNVPGPQFPLYGAGALLVANYPISTITDGAGLNITVQSYDGHLDIGVVGCRDLVPDIDQIVLDILTALDELRPPAKTPVKKQAKTPAKKRAETPPRTQPKTPAKKRARTQPKKTTG